MRVWAVKGTKWEPAGGVTADRLRPWTRATMLLPSGVSSATDASAARRPTSASEYAPIGMNAVARRLPIVMVPVLSSKSVSTSPATSTASATLGDHVGGQRAIHAGDPDGGEETSDGRGNQADEEGDERGHVRARDS